MEPLRICINTQTPLLQFASSPDGAPPVWSFETDFRRLEPGVDYRFSPGGVTRMVYPLARRLIADGVWKDVHWISLNPRAPETVNLPGITLHNVSIDRERMDGYGKVKETIWTTVHGLEGPKLAQDLFWTEDYGEYTFYNRTTAELIRDLDRQIDFDLFHIHDFQQLPIGHMLGTLKPKVFRWHIPFDASRIPEQWRSVFETYLRAYDIVVVSTDRYRNSLEQFGYPGRIVRIYPSIDPSEYGHPGSEEVARVAETKAIGPDDVVALVVGRMDPAKGQDGAMAALADARRRFPKLKLVLAGNGSFSGSKEGLGLSRAATWRQHLETTAKSRGVADRVIFTGHVTQPELDALYERSDFTILPSTFEGFGLVVVESWIHRRPVVVSDRAGVAELIQDGTNGLLFDPADPKSLGRAFRRVLALKHAERAAMVTAGAKTAERCTNEAAAREERRLLGPIMEA